MHGMYDDRYVIIMMATSLSRVRTYIYIRIYVRTYYAAPAHINSRGDARPWRLLTYTGLETSARRS